MGVSPHCDTVFDISLTCAYRVWLRLVAIGAGGDGMKCHHCGKEIRDGAQFCPECGLPVGESEDAAEKVTSNTVESSSEDEPADDKACSESERIEEAPADEKEWDASPAEAEDAISHEEDKADAEDSPVKKTEGGNTESVKRSGLSGRFKLLVGLLVIAVAAAGVGVGYLIASGGLRNESEQVALNLSEVEDEAFREYLAGSVDTDSDGMISQAEADKVTAMGAIDEAGALADQGLTGLGIVSLEGIEHFRNLESLVCLGNGIASLDLSQNSKLTYLNCEMNQLIELDLPGQSSLSVLHATGNQLTTIDLSAQSELTDVEVDDGVTIVGNPGPSDAETVTKLEDLALVYAVAASGRIDGEDLSGEVLVQSGTDCEIDNNLIEVIASPNLTPDRELLRSGSYLSELQQDNAGLILVQPQQGENVIRSVYGTLPGDLSYLFEGNGLAQYMGEGGWYVFPAEGTASFTISSDNWLSYGKLVRFDATVARNYGQAIPGATNEYIFSVTALEDEESLFGYHLVSMRLENKTSGGSETSDSSVSVDGKADGQGDTATDEMVESIVDAYAPSGESGRSPSVAADSSNSPSAQKQKEWPDFENLLGTWVGTFEQEEHNSVGGQAACYGGRNNPLNVTFTSVDTVAGTATADIRALVHSHGGLSNAAEGTEGDQYVELNDVLITIKKNSNSMYRVYAGKDLGLYYINFQFDENGTFTAEVYTEAKVTQPFVAWRRDTFRMQKQ